jgi:hypothetical protein
VKLTVLIAVAALVAAFAASTSRGGAAPGSGCGTAIATFHDGSTPTKRPILVPPSPGLSARAVAAHVVEFKWSFRSLPAKCRPVWIALSVLNASPYTPTTAYVRVRATSGTHKVKVADFIPMAREAAASAVGARNEHSKLVRVRITR